MMDKAEQPTIELLPCPFCQTPVQHRFALHVSDGNTDDIIHAAPTECGLQYFSVGSADQGVTVAKAWNARTTSLAAQDGLVAEIERQEGLVKTYRGAQLRAEEKLCREQANAQGWKRRAEILESKLAALSAIKEQHHD